MSRWVSKARACGLEIWTVDLETFNGRSGDLLDGYGVFGVDGCGLLVNLLWVLLGVSSRWVAVGLFRRVSDWFLVHRWCWVVGFGSPMGQDGLPGGL